ncbi:MAG: glycosyltransferase family 4 protein [Gemmatimonadota bacterium]
MVTFDAFYRMLGSVLVRSSFDGLRARSRRPHAGPGRIAYVLWRYPWLSQTFVRREVETLREAGVSVLVFAVESGDQPDVPGATDSSPGTVYFGPIDDAVGKAAIRAYARRTPWTVVRLVLFVIRHGALLHWPWWRDREIVIEAAQLATVLSSHGITHVHSTWADRYALISFVASRLIGATFSVQARASEIHRFAQAPQIADRLRFGAFIVTNSQYNARHLAAQMQGLRTPPIHVIYDSLVLAPFRALAMQSHEAPFRILAVGRLVEPKGFRHLLRACHRLRERGLAFTCEIIGGPMEPDDIVTWLELRMMHTALDLHSIVHFRGAQPFATVLDALSRADLFVLPCVRARDGSHDITPNSLIEAMAAGLPVISTTSGAIPEIVDDGIDGLLLPPGDDEALADAIERLANDPALRRALGAAACRKVETRFDSARTVAARVRLFQSLSGGGEFSSVESALPPAPP